MRKHEIWKVEENGILPFYNTDTISLPLKKGEIVHYAEAATLKKYKTKTEKVGFAGPTVSFKICKGVRYRAGLFDVHKKTSTYVDSIDSGLFYIANQRVVFVGRSKNFSYPLSKIIKTEMTDDGIVIQKANLVTPQIVELEEYDLPLSILSHLFNQ